MLKSNKKKKLLIKRKGGFGDDDFHDLIESIKNKYNSIGFNINAEILYTINNVDVLEDILNGKNLFDDNNKPIIKLIINNPDALYNKLTSKSLSKFSEDDENLIIMCIFEYIKDNFNDYYFDYNLLATEDKRIYRVIGLFDQLIRLIKNSYEDRDEKKILIESIKSKFKIIGLNIKNVENLYSFNLSQLFKLMYGITPTQDETFKLEFELAEQKHFLIFTFHTFTTYLKTFTLFDIKYIKLFLLEELIKYGIDISQIDINDINDLFLFYEEQKKISLLNEIASSYGFDTIEKFEKEDKILYDKVTNNVNINSLDDIYNHFDELKRNQPATGGYINKKIVKKLRRY